MCVCIYVHISFQTLLVQMNTTKHSNIKLYNHNSSKAFSKQISFIVSISIAVSYHIFAKDSLDIKQQC